MDKSVESLVLEVIQKGTLLATEIIKRVSAVRAGTTKQAVYQTLRKLKSEEKIAMHGKSVSLNIQWIKTMGEFFSLAEYYYAGSAGVDNFLNIKGRDKIIYFFKNLNSLDVFGIHALHMMGMINAKNIPLFAYNPHEWFFWARREAEEMFVETMHKDKRQLFLVSSHSDPLDIELRKHYQGDFLQYHIVEKPLFPKDNYYFVVFGDFLMEVYFDEKIIQELDDFYEQIKLWDENARQALQNIVLKSSKNKLVISCNTRKIRRYKKMLSPYFFVRV
ncbi:MAG: hypothetical protein AAB586_02610 [Patescibacteria group bacterium]